MGDLNSGNIAWYEANGTAEPGNTEDSDRSYAYRRFLFHAIRGGKVLDLGCGNGTDSLYLQKQGFQMTAIDGSERMCAFARANGVENAACMLFSEVVQVNEYEGIWARASLCELQEEELIETLPRLVKALKCGGCMYLSFPFGSEDGVKDGVYQLQMREMRLAKILGSVSGIMVLDTWRSREKTADGEKRWLNCVIRKLA